MEFKKIIILFAPSAERCGSGTLAGKHSRPDGVPSAAGRADTGRAGADTKPGAASEPLKPAAQAPHRAAKGRARRTGAHAISGGGSSKEFRCTAVGIPHLGRLSGRAYRAPYNFRCQLYLANYILANLFLIYLFLANFLFVIFF